MRKCCRHVAVRLGQTGSVPCDLDRANAAWAAQVLKFTILVRQGACQWCNKRDAKPETRPTHRDGASVGGHVPQVVNESRGGGNGGAADHHTTVSMGNPQVLHTPQL